METKAYFEQKVLKQKRIILNRGFKSKNLGVDKDACISVLDVALEICRGVFGRSWLTIDCYNQLGKQYWLVGERHKANEAFDKAIKLAKSMSLRQRLCSCLVSKGGFLIDSGDEKLIEEGMFLIENAIDLCKDFSDIRYWCLAMGYLVRVDKSKIQVIMDMFLRTDNFTIQ